ncbi:MAG: AAA family ATPase [Bacteroidales bacterium]|nr:AAA family ATPase [Bacteroidales bacterium]
MNQLDILPLVTSYHRRLADVTLSFKRSLYDSINWNNRLIGIRGARGAGKTTLLLQHIKETHPNPDVALYMSLDNLWFQTHDLLELIDYLYSHGITNLYFDEVHRQKQWGLILKQIYDDYPELKIVYTGSSMLEMDNSVADLSRRQTIYTLTGLSFREYLAFNDVMDLDAVPLSELLENHVRISLKIIKKTKILSQFEHYLAQGYYPFYKDAGDDYLLRLQAVSNLVIESDMPSVIDVNYATVEKTRKLLQIIAENVPMVPNVSRLCQALDTTRDSCLRMLYTLDRAQIVQLLNVELKNYKRLVAPNKIYLGNTNLMYALGSQIDEGNLRETFFVNQLSAVATVQLPKQGDALVDGKYLFEIGGPTKTFSQIADIPNSYLAIDGIETGTGSRIPLWMFGLLY